MVVKAPELPKSNIPLLQEGDRLTSEEFERRYEAMPKNVKAELIQGVVYMASPVRFVQHSSPQGRLITWLGIYESFTKGVMFGGHSSLRLNQHNEPQPDACLLIDPDRGGQAKIDTEGYIAASPELVAEVAASTKRYDPGVMLEVYREFGVREYIVWRVLDEEIDWFVLRDQTYHLLSTDAAGILKSEVFPGLWLDTAALLRGDGAAVNEVLQRGLATREHAAFIERLRQP